MDRMLDATAAAEDRHFWFKGLRRNGRLLITRGLAGRTPRLIVDCGSGTGRNLDWLSTFGPAVGVELSATGVAHGRRHHRRMVRASVTALPFANDSADVATSFDVLYCLSEADERQAIGEMWRVLRPGGIAVVNVAALKMLRGRHSAFTHEQRRYTRPSLTGALTAAGFRIQTLSFANMSVFPVALASRWFERVTGRGDQAADTDLGVPAAPVNAAFDGLLNLESAWLKIGNLPIGSSLIALVHKPAD